jgi:hypothetical protein
MIDQSPAAASRPERRARMKRLNVQCGVRTLDRFDAVLEEVQNTVLAPLTANERKILVRLLAELT